MTAVIGHFCATEFSVASPRSRRCCFSLHYVLARAVPRFDKCYGQFLDCGAGAQSLLLCGNGNAGIAAYLFYQNSALVAIMHIKVLWPWP
jgi:hypothetical protein